MNRLAASSGEPSPAELSKFGKATKARFMELMKNPTTAKQMAQLGRRGCLLENLDLITK